METYSITIKLNKSKTFGIFIGNNKRITFDYLLEYLTYNYPEENFCCCFKITDISNKVIIDKNTKIIDYINKTGNFIFSTNTPRNCNCNELLKDNYTKSKLKIIEDFEHIQKGYISTIEKMNNKINQLEKEKKIMGMAIKDPDAIDKLKSIGINENDMKPRDNLAKIDPKTNQIIGNEKNFNKNFIDFYDVIVDIKSIKDIIKGWEIKMSQNGKKNYEEYQKEKCIKIGVIGNSNKGKSFLLSKISKVDLPSGSSIRTEGLSIKYPNLEANKNGKIILLDSAGLETPVLKEINKLDNEDENKEKFNILLEEDKKTDTENTENIESKDEIKDEFREKSREKLITELFLQNYIINNSDILLLVVGILTYSEQKLINKIKALRKTNNKESNKPLYIIHNLMTYTLKSQVEEYINEVLLKSANFTLEEGHNISTNEKSIETKYYFTENKSNNIIHLIYANEGSEAGKTYNNLTLKFLWNSFQNVKNLEKFDVIKSIKKRFINISKEFFEKMDKNLTMNDFDEDSKSIKLKIHNNITLKKCLVDELGLSNLKSNEFEPKYNYYRKGDKIIIKIESPGNIGLINSSFGENEGYKIIKIIGEKKIDKEPENIIDNIFTSREFGKFILEIPVKCDDKYILKNEKPKIYDKKGLIFLEYQLEEIIEAENYIINEEEEI